MADIIDHEPWPDYESFKRSLPADLTPAEYEQAIREYCERGEI